MVWCAQTTLKEIRKVKGLYITITGLPATGKSDHAKFLASKLRGVHAGPVIFKTDLPHGMLETWRSYHQDESGDSALRLQHERDLIARSCSFARKMADAGTCVVLERHLCSASAVDYWRDNGAASKDLSYFAHLDALYGRPDLSIIVSIRQVGKLMRSHAFQRYTQIAKSHGEFPEIASMPSRDLFRARAELHRYVSDARVQEGNASRVMCISGDHRASHIQRRMWEMILRTFPDLVPDQRA